MDFCQKGSISPGQGDPFSPYVFVIFAKVLSHMLRECEDERGIRIHDIEMLVSQYATLFLNEDLNCLNFT